MPGEGKSTVTCNLARTLAQRRKRVLLVDADLRCSSIQAQYGSSPRLSAINASAVAICQLTVVSAISAVSGDLAESMQVVSAGFRPDVGPAEILASPEMQELMANVASGI